MAVPLELPAHSPAADVSLRGWGHDDVAECRVDENCAAFLQVLG